MSGKDDLDLEHAQFDAAAAEASRPPVDAPTETPTEAGPLSCAVCGVRIIDRYFRINQQTTCPRCTAGVREHHERGAPGAKGRAWVFGIAGGVLGALLYYGVALLAKAEFGIVALVVGILVGKGVRRGAGLHRHWLYPALGVGITYLAIASTYVPAVLEAFQGNAEGQPVTLTPGTLLGAWLFATVVPFFMLFQLEVWGPIILAIGLWEGWRYGKAPKLEFAGPFNGSTVPGLDEERPVPHESET